MESPPMGLGDFMALSSKALEESSKRTREGGVKYVEGLKRTHLVSSVLGLLALLSIIVAFWFMIQFAVKNAGLL